MIQGRRGMLRLLTWNWRTSFNFWKQCLQAQYIPESVHVLLQAMLDQGFTQATATRIIIFNFHDNYIWKFIAKS